MRHALIILAANSVSIALIVLAWWMMKNHIQNAGWLILGAMILAGGITISEKNTKA